MWAISERGGARSVGEEEEESLVEFTVSTPRMASSSSAGGRFFWLSWVGGLPLYLSVSDARQASKVVAFEITLAK